MHIIDLISKIRDDLGEHVNMVEECLIVLLQNRHHDGSSTILRNGLRKPLQRRAPLNQFSYGSDGLSQSTSSPISRHFSLGEFSF